MSRPRIAFFSPFNPQRSGVSDYSEELLPYLARHADVDLVADGYSLSNPEIAGRFQTVSVDQFLTRAAGYRMPVYQVANSARQHAYMLPCLDRFPGVVVLHDYFLHHLMLGITLWRGDFRTVRRILEPAHGDSAKARAWGLLTSSADPYTLSLVGPILDRARAIITHSEYARGLVAAERPRALVRVVPMAMPLIAGRDRRAIRQAHGFEDSGFVLASVSTLSYTKRIEVVIEAMSLLHNRCPQVRLCILGGGHAGNGALELIRRHGLGGTVRIVGWTPARTYEDLLVAADAVIDLRYPSGAETSASLMRAIAAGKPAIVSAQGSFLELPDEFAAKVAVGPGEAARVAAIIEDWSGRREFTAAMGEAAREHAQTRMRLDKAAEAYMEVIEAAQDVRPTANRLPFDSGASAAERLLYSSLYKACRAGFLLRTYGLSQAARRVRQASSGGSA